MLELVKALIATNPDREAFFRLVGRRFPYGSEDHHLIETAYNTAKDEFRDLKREGGERYFEHLRAVALIVMEHLRVVNADVIAAALLHDIIEDRQSWNQQRLALNFNRHIAQLVWWMSEQPVENFDGDKHARDRRYHENLRRAPREAAIIKLADRLHNLLTLWHRPKAKQLRKIEETEHFYLPLAEDHILLIHEIEEAITEATVALQ